MGAAPFSSLAPLAWFAAVLVAIPLLLWLLKRSPLGGAGAGGPIRSVAVLPVSTTQRIVTIEVGQGDDKRWLVLGVTPTHISTLHTMAPQPESASANAAAGHAPAAAFADLFARLRRRGAGADHG